jgi:hypothetical protein
MFKKIKKTWILKYLFVYLIMLNNLKNKVMKNMFALMLVCAMMATACSTNESTTTEATTESVDSLYRDTVELGGNVDTAAVAQ